MVKTRSIYRNKKLLIAAAFAAIIVFAAIISGCTPTEDDIIGIYEEAGYKISYADQTVLDNAKKTYSLEGEITAKVTATKGEGLFPSKAEIYICADSATANALYSALEEKAASGLDYVKKKGNAVAFGTESALALF